MLSRHYLVPSVLVSILIRRTPSVAHMFVFIPCSALMPGNKAIGPTGPAPSAVLVLRARQLAVPWFHPAALRALRRGPFGTIKERDLVQQCYIRVECSARLEQAGYDPIALPVVNGASASGTQ